MVVVVSLCALAITHLESKVQLGSLALQESGRPLGKQATSKAWQKQLFFNNLFYLFNQACHFGQKSPKNPQPKKTPGNKISSSGGVILILFLKRERKQQ